MDKGRTAQTVDRWVEVFGGALRLATVSAHSGRFDADELRRLSVRLPAVFVSALSAQPSEEVGDGSFYAEVVFGAYVLTGGQSRDLAGLNLQEAVRQLLYSTDSGIVGVQRPRSITWQNILSSKTTGQAVALNVVGWRQRLLVGEPVTDDVLATNHLSWPEGVFPSELYIE